VAVVVFGLVSDHEFVLSGMRISNQQTEARCDEYENYNQSIASKFLSLGRDCSGFEPYISKKANVGLHEYWEHHHYEVHEGSFIARVCSLARSAVITKA